MAKLKDFFSSEDKQMILDAIAAAESRTSGEIRVRVDKKAGKNPLVKARMAFEEMGMRGTKLNNGVLFYIAVKDKKFAIIGDDAINEKVPGDFWVNIKDAVISRFKEKEFALGLVGGINLAGEKLAEFFPAEKEDTNELPDGISYGKE